MKRMTLIAAALCLVMLLTVGAGVVAAKQTENPSQAGASHIYFYDVAPAPDGTHGKGKLQINVDKQKFEFNGQGFTPSQQYFLHATTASGAYVFAIGKATPSGNLHITGTWEAGAALPTAVIVGHSWYEYTYGAPITDLWLENDGAFVAKLACYYSTDGGLTWTESGHTGGIWDRESQSASLGELGVPYGALVKIHAIVVAGNDKTGSEVFTYQSSYPYDHTAQYNIVGTTLKPTLDFWGINYNY